MTQRPLTNDERIRALQAVDANVLWMHQPYRPPCTTCDASGRVGEGYQRGPCKQCDGIGTLRPKSKTSVRNLCAQILLDSEFHAAVVKAQRAEGATKPTEGSTAWSDPTGNAALSTAATEIRAQQIRAGWHAGLEIAFECVRQVSDLVRATLGIGLDTRQMDARSTVVRIHRLLLVPQNALEVATRSMDASTLAELDHAIRLAAECTANVRTGRPNYTGRVVPSMTAVLELHRTITEQAPPKPKQPERIRCRSCWRFGLDVDVASHSSSLCTRCIEFRKAHACMPTEAICRYWDGGRGKRGVPPAMLIEAKAQGKAKRRSA